MNANVDVGKLTVADFEARRDEEFLLQGPSGPLPLKLHTVQRLGPTQREGGAFSLQFLAPAGPFLPQAMYPLLHPGIGTIEIFLVPLGPREGGNCYEAIFA
jgi:hypothetical protein